MSYNRGQGYDYASEYEADLDEEVLPPPPPPPVRYGYTSESRPTGYTPPGRHGNTIDSDEHSHGYRQTRPAAPPALQAGGGGLRYTTPPGASSASTSYHSPPPAGTYQSPAASAYHESTSLSVRSESPPSYDQHPTHYNQSSPSSYSQGPRDFYSQVPAPPVGAHRGGLPVTGSYRAPPPDIRRTQPPPSAYHGFPQTPHTPLPAKRTNSYSEDYSAYGISKVPWPQTETEDLSDRVFNEDGAEDSETPAVLEQHGKEHIASTIGVNLVRDESIAAKIAELVAISNQKLMVAENTINKVIENDSVKLSKEQAETILSPAKDVIAVLDVVKKIHPVIDTVITIFTALIKLETDRRENDKSIVVLYLTIISLLSELSYLQPSFETANKIKPMLQVFLDKMCKTMHQFGNFCDVYYKQRSIVKMIRSGSYKNKLAWYATAFKAHKKELKYLMITKTVATVTKMDSEVRDVSAKLDQVLSVQSRKEKWIEKKIQELGGEEKVVWDEKLLAKIGKVVKVEINSQIKYALRENIDEAIKSNFARFSLKVETAMNEIKDAVQRSTETIMTRLDSGPHDLIEDEDIKAVWKDMNWRLSCKSRHFVDAVHHHFAQKFAKYRLEKREIHPEHWTLKFLSNVIFYPAIGDAIDEDGSGYLSVHEVDRFLKARPRGWTTTQ